MDIWLLVIFVVGFVVSFFGTVVGGFGLILVPLLMFLGLPPVMAVATTRMGIFSGTITSIYQFHKFKKIDYSIALPLAIVSAIGAFVGARILLEIDGEVFQKLLGGFIVVVLVLVLWKKDLGIKRLPTNPFLRFIGYIFLGGISVLSAIFSGGSGVLGRTALMLCFGQTLIESAGTRKVQNLVINITTTVIYVTAGMVHWPYAVAVIVGVGLGSYWGAAHGIKKGDVWVKRIFIIMLLILAGKLLLS